MKALITVTGSMRPKTGSSKTIKYRITYYREDATAEIMKLSS